MGCWWSWGSGGDGGQPCSRRLPHTRGLKTVRFASVPHGGGDSEAHVQVAISLKCLPSYLQCMILKPYVDREERDPRRSAGRRAERQMAHYLDRQFREHTRLHVLHDIRIEHGGEVAQMDHLVVHGFGVAIVESKSVSTSVRINAEGEWERRWDRSWRGMADPILQGERQGLVLQRLLASRHAELLDKVLGVFQGTFRAMALDVFAAISDDGTIQRAKRGQAPRAMKADAIPRAIEDLVASYRSDARILNPNLRAFVKAPRDFNETELLRIGHFLRVRSTNAVADPPAPEVRVAASHAEQPLAPPGDSSTRSSVVCKGCGGANLEATAGRYGPYAKCKSCSKNTAVRVTCDGCGAQVAMSARPQGFEGACSACSRRFEVGFSAGVRA